MRNEKLLLQTSGKISTNRKTLQGGFHDFAVYVINILSILVHLGHTSPESYSLLEEYLFNVCKVGLKLKTGKVILEQEECGVHEEG